MEAHNPLFMALFLSQILLISLIIPIWMKQKVKRVLTAHPEAEYPRLYPFSETQIMGTVARFQKLAWLIMLLGLGMLAHALIMKPDDLLNWDNQAVLTIYFLCQYLPFITLGVFAHNYHQRMRDRNPESKRQANLRPRTLSDYVPMGMIQLAAFFIIAYIGIIFYAQQNPFPGFAGLWNILYVLLLNLFFAAGIYFTINGKKNDPYISLDDRMMSQSLVAKLLVLSSISASLFLSSSILMSVFELKEYQNLMQLIYFQFIALLGFVTLSTSPVDYSVYAKQSINPSTGSHA